MSWVTFIWAMLIGLCVAMAFPQFVIWIWRRRLVDLLFVILTASVIARLANELMLMRSSSAEQFARAVQWRQLPLFVLFVATIGFVRLYFGTGRWWLAIIACAVRLACFIINFALPPDLYFQKITSLRSAYLLGDTVSVPVGMVRPWSYLFELSSLLLLAFVVDASITLWQQGKSEGRRRALIIGGSITFYALLSAGLGMMVHLKSMPALAYLTTIPFVAVVFGMAFELSYELFSAGRISQKLQLSEASLRESEARFRIVADSAPVLVWMSGVDKLCTFFNKPWLEFTGRAMEQEMGNGWAEGVHPDDLQKCLKTYVEAFDAREPFVMQYRLRRHDGEYRWIKDDGVPRYDAKGNFTGYIGSCVDVTESINNEQALRESEERMSLAVDAANLGLWEWNVRKDELWGTKARRALLGLPTSGKIKLEEALSTVHADDRDRVRQTMTDAARTGKSYHFEYRTVLPDGSIRWTEHRGRCLRGADGKDTILRGISMDVTEQRRSEEKFRLAVEASPSGILLVNETGEIVLVNAHMEELFGYGREELIGQSVEILVPEGFARHHPQHRAKFFAAPTVRPMGEGRQLFARRKDGSEFPVEIGLSPIETSEGVLVLAGVADISARKESEAEALRHREELSHLSRVAAMGELTASIAHELNQPLSGITINASTGQRLIDRGDGDLGELRHVLSDIMADARRAGDVIRGIQNMVKKGSSARQRLNLNDLVTDVVRLIIPNAMLHSCELKVLLEPGLPNIEADLVQMQQVLLNLVINALDAIQEAPVGRRKVLIATERTLTGAIRTSVRDYGNGIPEEVRARVFDQFFTTKAKGLGMGLAIVHSIIKSHDGSIVAENADGGGARFYFTLPAIT